MYCPWRNHSLSYPEGGGGNLLSFPDYGTPLPQAGTGTGLWTRPVTGLGGTPLQRTLDQRLGRDLGSETGGPLLWAGRRTPIKALPSVILPTLVVTKDKKTNVYSTAKKIALHVLYFRISCYSVYFLSLTIRWWWWWFRVFVTICDTAPFHRFGSIALTSFRHLNQQEDICKNIPVVPLPGDSNKLLLGQRLVLHAIHRDKNLYIVYCKFLRNVPKG